MAPTPARAASSTPSANGKNASEANTAPAGSCPCWRALWIARNEASTRDIWPAPIPTAAWSRASTMAFDLTTPTAAHANRRSRHSASVGARRLTPFHPAASAACARRDRRDGGIDVEQIVERQLLALELLQIADPGLGGGVQRRRLMRVLAVAQLLTAVERQGDPLGPSRRVFGEVAMDRGVVGGG